MTELRKIASRFYLILIVSLLGYWAFNSRESILTTYSQAKYSLLFVSAFIWFFAHFLSALIITLSFKCFIGYVSYRDILRIHIRRLPYKYLPGGVWNSVARASDYSGFNFGAKQLARYFLVENLIIVGVTFLVGGGLVAIYFADTPWRLPASVIALAGVLVLLFLASSQTLRAANKSNTSLLPLLAAVLSAITYWLLLACSFLVFVESFPSLRIDVSQMQVIATFIFSWAIGYVAIFAPQGIGVSEYMTTELMSSSFSAQEMITFLMGFRIIGFIVDNTCSIALHIGQAIVARSRGD